MDSQPIPCWIKKTIRVNDKYENTISLLKELSIKTVCESAVCPNIYECFCKSYVSFMILGTRCTRNCLFCGVNRSSPQSMLPVDRAEPIRIAEGIKKMGMNYAVITSPTRDDLPDGGASQFAAVTKLIKAENPSVTVELLIPDFKGDTTLLKSVMFAGADIVSHNIETVKNLYPSIRPSSCYTTSINILREIAKNGFVAKSGFMLGLGETEHEVIDLMRQIRQTGCTYLVIGQYLKPAKQAVDVKEFIHPDIFKKYEEIGKSMGFKNVLAGPFYRSSYMAEQLL